MMETAKASVLLEKASDLLDANELSEVLKCSKDMVYLWHRQGKLPKAIRLGRILRWSKVKIEKWLQENQPEDGE